MKKSIFMWIVLTIALCLCFSCEEPYKMPYTPGVTVDEESLAEHKTLWENSGIKNYSYTYSYNNNSYPCYNCAIDVVIENDIVTEYDIKNYIGKSTSEMSEEEWRICTSTLLNRLEESTDFLRIDAIYDYIERNIKEHNEDYNKNPDCFYANISAEYLGEIPFISYYKSKFLLMQEGLVGNGATIEIKIENFKAN